MQPDFDAFFADYVAAYNRSLGDSVDDAAIRGCFADSFIAAGPQGVMTGNNDETFSDTLRKGYAFYKSIGTRSMAVEGVEVTGIDPMHFLARVSYRAAYDKDGEEIVIPFSVSYLLQYREDRLRIFAFIAGDEMAIYRRYGLVADDA